METTKPTFPTVPTVVGTTTASPDLTAATHHRQSDVKLNYICFFFPGAVRFVRAIPGNNNGQTVISFTGNHCKMQERDTGGFSHVCLLKQIRRQTRFDKTEACLVSYLQLGSLKIHFCKQKCFARCSRWLHESRRGRPPLHLRERKPLMHAG